MAGADAAQKNGLNAASFLSCQYLSWMGAAQHGNQLR
jgi:hypothetical protein